MRDGAPDRELSVPVFAAVILLPCWMVAAFLFARPERRELRWLAAVLVAVYAFYTCVLGAGGLLGPASPLGLAAVANAFVWRGLGTTEGRPDGGPSGEADVSVGARR